MKDTPGTGCGIYPLIFHGWMDTACQWHDLAYTEGSWHQAHMTRKEVDDEFFRMCLLLAEQDCCKEAQALACYKVVRAVGWIFWEGQTDKEDEHLFLDWPAEKEQDGNRGRWTSMAHLRAAFKEATPEKVTV